MCFPAIASSNVLINGQYRAKNKHISYCQAISTIVIPFYHSYSTVCKSRCWRWKPNSSDGHSAKSPSFIPLAELEITGLFQPTIAFLFPLPNISLKQPPIQHVMSSRHTDLQACRCIQFQSIQILNQFKNPPVILIKKIVYKSVKNSFQLNLNWKN